MKKITALFTDTYRDQSSNSLLLAQLLHIVERAGGWEANTHRKLRDGGKRMNRKNQGTKRVWGKVVSGTATLLLVGAGMLLGKAAAVEAGDRPLSKEDPPANGSDRFSLDSQVSYLPIEFDDIDDFPRPPLDP